ncbi:hypothetical protein N2152v2_007283 [Parachlorella kessleri]
MAKSGAHTVLAGDVYATSDYPEFDQALAAFLKTQQVAACEPQSAAIAVAGPVRDNRAVMTNLGWVIDGPELQKQFGFRVEVLNDFEAVGYGVPELTDDDIITLHDVPAHPKGPKAVLGPGTGLGEAQLFWDDALGTYRVCPSEGAHSGFAPRGWKQLMLCHSVERELGHVDVEHVACGSGLVRIYDFLRRDEPSQYPGVDLSRELDPAGVSRAAVDGSNPVASEALDIFLAIIGAEAANMALRGLSSGGVYIAGGIIPKVLDRVKQGGVLDAFLWRASRFHEKVLKDVPLHVVTNDKIGLLGARAEAVRAAKRVTQES